MASKRKRWSTEEDAVLKSGLIAGETYAAISRMLPDRTRNACTGQAHRKGYALLGAGHVKSKPARKSKRKYSGKMGSGGQSPATSAQDISPRAVSRQKSLMTTDEMRAKRVKDKGLPDLPVSAAAGRVKSEHPVKFMDRKDDQCSWPIGDPRSSEFRMCGNDKGGHEQYCDGHASCERQKSRGKRMVPDRRDVRAQQSPARAGIY